MAGAFLGGLQMPIKTPSCRLLENSEHHREVDGEQNTTSASSGWTEPNTLLKQSFRLAWNQSMATIEFP